MYRRITRITRTGCVLAAVSAAALAPAAHADMLNPQPLPPGHHVQPITPSALAFPGQPILRRLTLHLLPPDPCVRACVSSAGRRRLAA